MKFGVAIFPTDYAISMGELAPVAEDLGFESLWVAEHSHIPTSRLTKWPGGAELPKHYWHTMDPFIALTVAALASKTIRVGTGICLVIQRDPIHTAKEVASLDVLSKGRFLFGIGAGWNLEEMANHGTTQPEQRGTLLRERIEAMQAIWREKQAEYHGKFVDFGPMMTWPKPVQKPYPPILIGGNFPNGAKRAIAFGDAWMPHAARPEYADVVEFLPRFRQMAAEAGREPDAIPVTVFGAPAEPDRVKRYRDAGVARICVSLPSEKDDTILPLLDRWAAMMR